MSSDERSASTSSILSEDLTRSLEDAFQFTSVSRSPFHTTSSTPVLPHPLVTTPLSPSRSSSATLITEHRLPSSPSTAPNTPSKSGAKAALDLERFLDDQTPITLTNVPLRHSSHNLLTAKPKSAPSTPSRSSISTLVRQDDGKLIYTIAPADTLEGLSLRFGIKVAELKKANKLFSTRDFGIRRTFIIPLSDDQYQKYLEELSALSRREEAHRKEVVELFIERTNVSLDVAELYLSDSHYQLARAMERYHLENSSTTEPLDIRPTVRSTFGLASSSYNPPNERTTKLMPRSYQDQMDELFDL